MNYLAHALPFLDKPYFAAATGVPDWLSVVDRKVRLRKKHVEPFLYDDDPILAAVAGGVAQHLADDERFHGTRAFFEVTGAIADLSRAVLEESCPHSQPRSLPNAHQKEKGAAEASREDTKTTQEDTGAIEIPETERGNALRAHFLGHLLCEVLLDAVLVEENPQHVVAYYEILDQIDPAAIEAAVNRMAPRKTEHLAFFIGEFRTAKILWDYREDAKLMMRMNQVMRRIGLPLLPDEFATILPEARRIVANRKDELLK
jgi:hypothetical protein